MSKKINFNEEEFKKLYFSGIPPKRLSDFYNCDMRTIYRFIKLHRMKKGTTNISELVRLLSDENNNDTV